MRQSTGWCHSQDGCMVGLRRFIVFNALKKPFKLGNEKRERCNVQHIGTKKRIGVVPVVCFLFLCSMIVTP